MVVTIRRFLIPDISSGGDETSVLISDICNGGGETSGSDIRNCSSGDESWVLISDICSCGDETSGFDIRHEIILLAKLVLKSKNTNSEIFSGLSI